MLGYTYAIPNHDNFITSRFTSIVLGAYVFISGYFMGSKNINLNKHSLIPFYKKRLLSCTV